MIDKGFLPNRGFVKSTFCIFELVRKLAGFEYAASHLPGKVADAGEDAAGPLLRVDQTNLLGEAGADDADRARKVGIVGHQDGSVHGIIEGVQ